MPEYYYQETAKSVIRKLSPARIVLIFRNPARRVLSMCRDARNNRAMLTAAMDFSTFVEEVWGGAGSFAIGHDVMLRGAIEHGKYIRNIEDWVARIGRERLLAYLFDDTQADPRKLMYRLAHDLCIDPAFYGD